ncbi:MAG: AraC family transcriptional regulator [Leptospirales bacterium]|nr:AraC family transcriptional regulator [Leptospirales bacterium]
MSISRVVFGALEVWLIGGALFALVWAAGLALRRRELRDRGGLLALLLLLAALFISESARIEMTSPWLSLAVGALNWMIGLAIAFYFQRSILLVQAGRRRAALHFAAPLLSAFAGFLVAPQHVVRYAPATGALALAAYSGYILWKLNASMQECKNAAQRYFPQLKLMIIFQFGLLGTVAEALHWHSGLLLWRIEGPLILFVAYWLAQAQPALLDAVGSEVRRYARSRLGAIDPQGVLGDLQRLMRDEKLYADEDLSLARLGAELGLSAHQLSELLNRIAGRSFHDYVNDFRVAEAKRLLQNEEQRSALSIALAVGFDSKSTFYRAFRQRAGMSPGDFRAAKKNRPSAAAGR